MTATLPGVGPNLGARIAIRVHGTPNGSENPAVERDSRPRLWDNENAPAGVGSTTRRLTHSSDSTREGLA